MPTNPYQRNVALTLAAAWLALSSCGAYALGLFINPDCPSPANQVAILAYQHGLPALSPTPLDVTRTGNTIKFVAQGSYSSIGEAPPTSVEAPVGQLAIGDYRVDFYIRFRDSTGAFGPEQLFSSKNFSVQDNPPPCTPAAISAVGGAFQITTTNTSFAAPLQVLVVDGQQRPVPGITVTFMRFNRPEDIIAPNDPKPDVTFSGTSAITDANGVAQVTATANNVSGVAQYSAFVNRANVVYRTFFVLANRTANMDQPLEPVVEYLNTTLGHYFMTANSAEMSVLDRGVLSGWARTGAVFLAFTPGSATMPTGSSPVCRFYGRPEAGLDSHFFSASPIECQEVEAKFGASWLLETSEAFDTWLPDQTTGACPTGAASVFRVYNNRPDANHRYSTSSLVVQQMIASGWLPEGYGQNAVVMCVPQ